MAKISKSWGDTFAELPTGKVAADAMIGGGVGMGANYMANNSSGDSGGYLQAGLIGGALGGVTRGVLAKSRGEAIVAAKPKVTPPNSGPQLPPEPGMLSNLYTGVRDKSVSMYASGKAMINSVPTAIAAQKVRIAEGASEVSDTLQRTLPKSSYDTIVPELPARNRGTLEQLAFSRDNPTPVDSFLQGANYSHNTRGSQAWGAFSDKSNRGSIPKSTQ